MSANDNLIQPFYLASGLLRGVLVRAGRATADTMGAHAYPPAVARLLAESLALGVVLSATLKYDGLFTLQIRGDGPVRALVVDVTSAGMIRGIARFDGDRLPTGETPTLSELTGTGLLAFTVDQGVDTEPCQGIVSLEGETVGACALRYMEQSEQIPTRLMIAARPVGPEDHGETTEESSWRSAALLLQRMPRTDASKGDFESWEESWNTASIMMKTLGDGELTDPALSPERLLSRLFHEEDLRLGEIRPIFYGCRCSPQKVLRMLAGLPKADRAELEENGLIEVVCDFCQTRHSITPEALNDYMSPLTTPEEE